MRPTAPGGPPLRSPASPLLARAMVPLLIVMLILLGWLAELAGSRTAAHRDRATASAPATPRPATPAVAPPPLVAPVRYADLTPDQARASNAAHPVATGPLPVARPFLFPGDDADRRAARTCLAAALLYEAGDDREGEQAVAQVVLNRLRHPAFPKTVCGVVFQGAERPTGCQFTFACDGALARPPQPAAWVRAQAIADAALSGTVYRDVGTATHYHADYVVPYWRDTLAKLATLRAHIFYRWAGWWGTSAAFTGRAQAIERMDPRIVALAGPAPLAGIPFAPEEDLPPPPPLKALSIEGVPARALQGGTVRLKDEAAAQFVLQLDPATPPARWAVTGFTICGERPDCMVFGWTEAANLPRALPVLPRAMASLAFLYRKSSLLDRAAPAWDCRRFPRRAPGECLPGTGTR